MRRPTDREKQKVLNVIGQVKNEMQRGRDFWSAFYSYSGLSFYDDIQRFAFVARAIGESDFAEKLKAGVMPFGAPKKRDAEMPLFRKI